MKKQSLLHQVILKRSLSAGSVILLLFLLGCYSIMPKEIMKEINRKVSLGLVKSNPDAYIGTKVLWGGMILMARNEVNRTVIEVIETPLDSSGRPLDVVRSTGRFLIDAEGFLDAAIYAKEREVTVAGEIVEIRTHQIGKMDYLYPVVRPIKIHLWNKKTEYIPPAWPPYYYSPFYDPYFWPYSPYYMHPPRRYAPLGKYPDGYPQKRRTKRDEVQPKQ